ncbi:MAG: Ldh family oxidoreductase [Candidatus Bathyarchaeia archaeon]
MRRLATPILTAEELTNLARDILEAAGATKDEARIVSGSLVGANLAGVDSHGVLRLTSYVQGLRNGVIRSGVKNEIVKETSSSLLINGNWGFGQVVCADAMSRVIAKAKETGIAAAGVFNCNHIGRLADYTQMAIKENMIGFITVNSDPCVAPYGGRKIVLSTNPLSYGIPAGQEMSIVVDFATSVAAEGKVQAALAKGQQLPPGWILDSKGRPSTNPADLYEPPLPPVQAKLAGALLPAGGYKGYGLGLVIEILAGALTGSGCGEEVTSGLTNGVFMQALNIDKFVSLQMFKERVDRLIRLIRNSPKAEGFEEILIPGELELREQQRRTKTGIPIPERGWATLQDLCKQYGVESGLLKKH